MTPVKLEEMMQKATVVMLKTMEVANVEIMGVKVEMIKTLPLLTIPLLIPWSNSLRALGTE
jgi:hypothetical protein